MAPWALCENRRSGGPSVVEIAAEEQVSIRSMAE
jgi:hypothetical protein